MLPFNLSLVWALRLGALAAIGVGGLWLVDAIGDRREAKVWRKINAAIAQTNDDIGEQNELADRVRAVAVKARERALIEAKQKQSGACPLTAHEAQALARVR